MLSRLAQPSKLDGAVGIACVRFIRASSSLSSEAPPPPLRPEEMDDPGFFQKIILRFKGIPLKGEVHPPRSIFQDVDKEWFAPKVLPTVPRDYKEHPDRDLVNYPYPARRMYPPKTRMLMIPDSWMTPFYNVTGVSGPYLFFGGLLAFLINKEIYVLEEQAHMLVGWILFYLLLSRTIGYRLDNWLYGEYIKRMDHFKDLIKEDLKEATEFRQKSKAESHSLAALKTDFPIIFKENMALQLEAAYRQNVAKVASEMKRRLDFLRETDAARQRFIRSHMLNWITKGVRAEVESNKDKVKDKYLDSCISELKNLPV
ncbi:hypothetical protein AB6A40_006287 [Gnathostoma spinigerum]|uniref:ATP synthase subunit b n=1 Tax=Gnathostoma spinigerum TaxID=75299 RepID=A0ABD6EI58_9BILA